MNSVEMSSKHIDWFRQDILLRSVVLDLAIVTQTALRIGAGRGTDPASPSDLPVIKIHVRDGATIREVAYIPGSSLKGLIRSACEFIARSCGIYVCKTLGKESCSERDDTRRVFEEALRHDNYENCLNILRSDKVCLICKMFGSSLSASLVNVDDAFPEADTPLRVRVCVAIDRNTGAAAYRALYNYEYVEPGIAFRTRITCLNLPNYALGLLIEGLRCIDMGLFKLGGFKSRGLGRVNLRIERVTIIEPTGFRINKISIDKDKILDKEATLRPLDSLDSEVRFRSMEELLNNLVEAWYSYVNKVKSSS